jgi:hypothetical protein
VRLVSFDTPEAGSNARCEGECNLAARATAQLRALVAGGGLDLIHRSQKQPAST